ncbi:4Fe-4S binding protein [Virgibacillus sp. NKC19-3]|uniref:4Fe-4S binding protein n=1 Tax=Virgibacillus saliphilus TaxID=2831674 RepID=UPI001C9B1D80|nr:4Fe-4S binding protein [Virgibacillus sp. NKC19-3]MBY7142086.1 4Fe-4S binding protein [Virgibacillus sp. NKC19-3]
MKLFSNWLESLDYKYAILPHCSRYQSPRSTCRECMDSCPTEAISLVDGKPVIHEDSCIECGYCVASCPVQAVEGFLPKRTIKNKTFIMDEGSIPTVKELLIYYKEGITTIVCEKLHMNPTWEETINKANQVLEKLGEPPFQVNFEQVGPSNEAKLSRRELFFKWEKDLEKIGKNMAPAKWRFNHERLDLSKYYPDHQFVNISLDTDKCTLCKACQILCKKNSLEISESHFSISAGQCSNCSLCQDICPEGAISIKQMISPASTVDHQIYTNVCSSCGETFGTLREEQRQCFFCMKKDEYALV